jgi:hypothetical protein
MYLYMKTSRYYSEKSRQLQPAQRLRLYRSLLKLYRSGYDDGLCLAISKLSRKLPTKNLVDFPELLEQRPRQFYRKMYNGDRIRTGYWWAPTNRQKRIEVLEKAIATLSYQLEQKGQRRKNGKVRGKS